MLAMIKSQKSESSSLDFCFFHRFTFNENLDKQRFFTFSWRVIFRPTYKLFFLRNKTAFGR